MRRPRTDREPRRALSAHASPLCRPTPRPTRSSPLCAIRTDRGGTGAAGTDHGSPIRCSVPLRRGNGIGGVSAPGRQVRAARGTRQRLVRPRVPGSRHRTRARGRDQDPARRRLAGAEDVERFLREARSAAQLKHPGIVALYEAGRTDDGVCYLVEEFVRGVTLAEQLKTGPLEPHAAARYSRKSPTHSTPPTDSASFTATSSRRTSSSTPRATRTSPTSAWPSATPTTPR